MVTLNESLSALMDGEAAGEEIELALARMKDDAALRRTWDTYHLIGDTLRGHGGADLAARVARGLAAEPTVLAPGSLGVSPRRAAWYAAAAAGLAAVALVAWTALPLVQPPVPTSTAEPGTPLLPVAADTPQAPAAATVEPPCRNPGLEGTPRAAGAPAGSAEAGCDRPAYAPTR
jgi:sigma-E factor negative regulatory protein RseA